MSQTSLRKRKGFFIFKILLVCQVILSRVKKLEFRYSLGTVANREKFGQCIFSIFFKDYRNKSENDNI